MGGLAGRQHLPAPPRRKWKGGLVMPYLQMQDAAGQWKTVSADMGMPAGKPKTIAVDLQFPGLSRKLRIVTNLCVYWDEIFLSEGASQARVKQQEVPMLSANLHFRGFSRAQINPEAQTARYFFLRRRFPDFVLESHQRALYALRRYPRITRGCGRPAGDSGIGRRDPAAIFQRARTAPAGLDARFSAESGWMGQGPRPEHRVRYERRAAAVPCDEPVSLPCARTFSGR